MPITLDTPRDVIDFFLFLLALPSKSMARNENKLLLKAPICDSLICQ